MSEDTALKIRRAGAAARRVKDFRTRLNILIADVDALTKNAGLTDTELAALKSLRLLLETPASICQHLAEDLGTNLAEALKGASTGTVVPNPLPHGGWRPVEDARWEITVVELKTSDDPYPIRAFWSKANGGMWVSDDNRDICGIVLGWRPVRIAAGEHTGGVSS